MSIEPPPNSFFEPKNFSPITGKWSERLQSWLGTPKRTVQILICTILGIYLAVQLINSVYTIPTDSIGIVTRFEKPQASAVLPGLHIKIPFIDKVIIVPVSRQMKQEFGYSTPDATNTFQSTDQDDQILCEKMLTGDLNEVRIHWVIQYRITDPNTYLFANAAPEVSLRDLSESAMLTVAGDRTIDEIMTFGRQDAENQMLDELRVLTAKYQLGIKIDQIQLKMVNPPRPVEAAFNEVNQSKQQREELINIAHGEYNKRIPRAKGEANQTIAEAQGYATQRVNEALGNVSAFNQLLVEYKKAPEITKKRLYLESMAEILPRVKNQVIIDGNVKSILPTLPLNTLPSTTK